MSDVIGQYLDNVKVNMEMINEQVGSIFRKLDNGEISQQKAYTYLRKLDVWGERLMQQRDDFLAHINVVGDMEFDPFEVYTNAKGDGFNNGND